MNTEFCINCGGKVQYTLKKPNFCSSCGCSINAKEISSTEIAEGETALDKSENQLPSLSRLEYEIGGAPRIPTFGDLVAQASADPKGEYNKMPPRPDMAQNPGEDIIQATLDQCRSAREPKEVGGQTT